MKTDVPVYPVPIFPNVNFDFGPDVSTDRLLNETESAETFDESNLLGRFL